MAKIFTLLIFGKQYALSTEIKAKMHTITIIPKVNGETDTSNCVGANVGSGLGSDVGVLDGYDEGILVGYFCWIATADCMGTGVMLTVLTLNIVGQLLCKVCKKFPSFNDVSNSANSSSKHAVVFASVKSHLGGRCKVTEKTNWHTLTC